MITTVTGKHQITIPAKLANQLHITSGTRLDWQPGRENRMVVRVLPDRASLASSLIGVGRKHLKRGVHPIADLIKERQRDEEKTMKAL